MHIMKCPKCKSEEFKDVSFICSDYKGKAFDCVCGHRIFELRPRNKDEQRRLNEVFNAKKDELTR